MDAIYYAGECLVLLACCIGGWQLFKLIRPAVRGLFGVRTVKARQLF